MSFIVLSYIRGTEIRGIKKTEDGEFSKQLDENNYY